MIVQSPALRFTSDPNAHGGDGDGNVPNRVHGGDPNHHPSHRPSDAIVQRRLQRRKTARPGKVAIKCSISLLISNLEK